MHSPPRLRIQRTSRGLRWSAWKQAQATPELECLQPYHAEPLDHYLHGFYRLAEGNMWQRTPEEPLRQAIELLGKRLGGLIPPQVQEWIQEHHHFVIEAHDSTIPWELAHLSGKPLWQRVNLRRSPYPAEEKAAPFKGKMRFLVVGDSDGTLSFCNKRAARWEKRLTPKADIETISAGETALEPLSRRLAENPYHVLVWNATNQSYGDPSSSHLWLFDQPVTSEMWKRAVKKGVPPVVILNWHSIPEQNDNMLRCQQVGEWATLLQEMGVRAVLGSAWDHEEMDLLWLDTMAEFSSGSSLFTSLRKARLKSESKSWSHSALVYAGVDVGQASEGER